MPQFPHLSLPGMRESCMRTSRHAGTWAIRAKNCLSMTIPDLDPNFPHSRWGDHWEQLKKEGFLHFESLHRRKDGALIPMDISVNYLSFGGREYNIGFALDISERKRAENELRLSYSLNKTIIDSVNDAISLIDVRDFTIVSANNVFLKNYGYSDQAEIAGKHCYEITHHRPDMCSAPDDICPFIETVKTKDHFSVDHVHYDRKGKKIFVEVSTSPIRDETGQCRTGRACPAKYNRTERGRGGFAGLRIEVPQSLQAIFHQHADIRARRPDPGGEPCLGRAVGVEARCDQRL